MSQQAMGCSVPWCTVQTSPHTELNVCRHLAVLGLESYTPEFLRGPHTRRGSVRDRRHHWLFPGYVFFRSPEGSGAHVVVRRLPGVVRILGQDGEPALLSDSVIRHIRRQLAEGALRPPGPRFTPGERLVIDRGPLAPLNAIFDRELDDHARVQVLIHLMGRELPVSIDAMHLKSMAS